MLDLRMAREVDLAGNPERFRLGVDAVEFDRRRADLLDALQAPEEIEMPPRAAKLAVGRELESDRLLSLDGALNLAVLDRLERRGVDLALGEFDARLLQRGRAQQAADMVGAERWRGALGHWCFSLLFLRADVARLLFWSWPGLSRPSRLRRQRRAL